MKVSHGRALCRNWRKIDGNDTRQEDPSFGRRGVGRAGRHGVVVPPLLWGDGVDYSRVTSIKSTREYQDPALLAKAWALPVAAKYHSEIDFQGNGSFCGPTSLVNVMRSLGLGGDQRTVLAGTDVSTFLGFLPGGITLDRLPTVAEQRLGQK